ncbi:MAG: hypothetical protein U0414_09610 [Polyangiaceae bacterium]
MLRGLAESTLARTSRAFAAAALLATLAGCGSTATLLQTADAPERPSTWSRGGEIGPRCLDLDHEDELLCRADKRLMEARTWGDERALACYVRKGRELRTAYRMAQNTRERLKSGESAVERERLVSADRLLERSFVELEACNGPLDGEADSVRVERPKELLEIEGG